MTDGERRDGQKASDETPIIPPAREPARDPSRQPKKEAEDDTADEDQGSLPGEDLPDVHVKIPVKRSDDEEEDGEDDADDDADDESDGAEGLPRFITTLAPIEHQVGMQIIEALRRKEISGVVTTVMQGPDGLQRIVSVGLDNDQLSEVDRVVTEGIKRKRAGRVPCIGFHCRVHHEESEEHEEHEEAGG